MSLPHNLHTLITTAERILLLQGPLGNFFQDLSNWLHGQGKTVFKLNFNRGDETFYPDSIPNTFAYQGTFADFDGFLTAFIEEYDIQAIVCFGDTRPYHAIARQICEHHAGLNFWAFEEGYFRPSYVTLERGGVNADSFLPRNPAFFLAAFANLKEREYSEPVPVKGGFLPVAKYAVRYYLSAISGKKHYPDYIHHRDFTLRHYSKLWLLSGFKRLHYWLRDRHFADKVNSGAFGRFFIVPLQVFNDSQVRIHSDFSSVHSFLQHVLSSFAVHAPKDVNLIIKHHPMDRGFINYRNEIARAIRRRPDLKNRIFYIHDVPLPVLLRHGIGMVTLNSTSGLSALIHNMPVKTLGRAAYDIPGITDQQTLAEFWQRPIPPDSKLFHAYRMYHINVTQIQGNFYSTVRLPASKCTD